MRAAAWLRWLLVAWLGLAMISDLGARRRQIIGAIAEEVEGVDAFVDAGIVLHVVVADPLRGTELLAGKPKLRIVRTHRFGGIIDTRGARPYVCAPSQRPVVWYCSEEQEPVVLHSDTEPLGQLVLGSEGAGKSTALAMWHALRWLEHLGERREGLQTAPTGERLSIVRAEMFKLYPRGWYRYRIADEILDFCDGTALRFISTHRQSEAQGSPVQGFNASWAGRDEGQDQVEAHEDIESRGRSAPVVDGLIRYKQLITATAKDHPDWRTLRDMLEAAKLPDGRHLWIRRTLLIERSPFVGPTFLAQKQQTMSEREFLRRYKCVDLPSERATYPAWNRELNLVTIPAFGWVDVTSSELARWQRGGPLAGLVGHDPGSLCDVSLLFKAFRPQHAPPTTKPWWIAVDEITTEQTTTEQHLVALLRRLREVHRLNLLDRTGRPSRDAAEVLAHADPYGFNDSKPDKSLYTQFTNAGVYVRPAAYKAGGTTPGRVPLDAGIEVVNMLLCSAAQERRLYVARDAQGRPCAPNLVRAFESAERDLYGKADTQKKDKRDVSHWPAAARYALWRIERVRLHLDDAGTDA